MTRRKLTASELATILAALRMFQREYEGKDAATISNEWPHFEDDPPLSADEIDTLCEDLNCGEVYS